MMALASRRNAPAAASKVVDRIPDEYESERDVLAPIVLRCQQGDTQAQRELYERCQDSVYRLVARMVGDQAAPDVAQDVFLQALRTLRQFSGRSRFETWLYRLSINECLQFLRRARREPCERLTREPEDRSPGEADHLQHRELLEQALAQIDPDLRSVFLLREIEGLSYGELAEALGIPEGTVASRLNRARTELQRLLRELGWEL